MLAALVAGIGVTVSTPASEVSREEALARLALERESMEGEFESPLDAASATTVAAR